LDNIEESMDMSSDITLTSNFINQNKPEEGKTGRYLDITPEQERILDRTKVLGGNYATYVGSVHSKNRMASSGLKEKRIMPGGEEHEIYEDFHSGEMKKRFDVVNTKNANGKNLFDVAKGARSDFLKGDGKPDKKPGFLKKLFTKSGSKPSSKTVPQTGGGRKYDLNSAKERHLERKRLKERMITEFSQIHNTGDKHESGGIDKRQVMYIMHTVTGGRDMEDDERREFLQTLGGSDMEKKKPILDAYMKNSAEDMMNFDPSMSDEENIIENFDLSGRIVGQSLADQTMEGQVKYGYEMNPEHRDIKKKSAPFQGAYGFYGASVFDKYGMAYNNSGSFPAEILDESKKAVKKHYGGGMKDMRAEYGKEHKPYIDTEPTVPVTPVKKPWWKR
jgi:hypothetical protein